MPLRTQKILAILFLLAVLAGGALYFKHLRQAHDAADQWTLLADERFLPDPSYAQRWDAMAAPLPNGGLIPHPWPHALRLTAPRGPMLLTSTLKPDMGQGGRWLQLVLTSRVDYFEVSNEGGQHLPRSRVSGPFGQLTVRGSRGSLTVGQVDVDGQQSGVLSVGFPWTAELARSPLQLRFGADRLELRLGAQSVSTLITDALLYQSNDVRPAVSGEGVELKRLVWEAGPIAPLDRTLAEADSYQGAQRQEDFLALVNEAEAISATPRVLLRKAQVLVQLGRFDEAAALYARLTAPGSDGFFAGYARLAQARMDRRRGRKAFDIDRDLAGMETDLVGHPALAPAELLRAQLEAEILGPGPGVTDLALRALHSQDLATSRAALDFLSRGDFALPDAQLLAALEPDHGDPRESLLLSDILMKKKAELQARVGDLPGLLATVREARLADYDTRQAIDACLGERLEAAAPKGDAATLSRILGPAAEDLPFLRDYLFVRGYPLTLPPRLQPSHPRHEDGIAALLAGLPRLGGAEGSPAERAFCDAASLTTAARYGTESQPPTRVENGVLCLDYRSGTYWGCGLSIGPSGPLRADGSIDLSGARRLKARVKAPKGAAWNFLLTESGCGPAGTTDFKGQAGADGEQYLLPPQTGTGQWQDVDLPLTPIFPAMAWGKLDGNHVLDLQAIKSLDLAVPGGQGAGTICISRIRFSGD